MPTAAQVEAVKTDTVDFQRLPVDEAVTSMALTEDGQFLVLSHQADNRLSIWDVRRQERVKTLETSSPRSVLCRNGLVFVANAEEGSISVFAQAQNWQLANQLQVGKPKIVHLSAPQGGHFENELLVTCHGEGSQGSYRGASIYRLNVDTDKAEQVVGASLATISYDGKLVITQGSFNVHPAGGMSAYPARSFVPGGTRQPLFEAGIQHTPYVYQVHPGSLWLGDNIVFGGVPLGTVGKDLGRLLIPDLSQRLIYTMTRDRFTARRLNAGLDEIGGRRINLPQQQARDVNRLFDTRSRIRNNFIDHPLAYTHPEALYLFVIDIKGNMVLHARTAAFEQPTAGQNDSTGEAAPSNQTAQQAPGTGTAEATKPQSAASSAGTEQLGIPARVVEGEDLAVQLVGPNGSLFELMGGPRGMTIGVDGRLTWKPSASHVGSHELKIKVSTGNKVEFVRPTIEVVSRELVARSGGQLTDVDRFERLVLEPDHYQLTPGHRYQSLLLLQGDQIKRLGPDGFSVTQQFKLPRRYDYVAERGSLMIAVGTNPNVLDILDQATRKFTRSIPLDAAGVRILEVTDLAVHPHRPVSYVAIKHDIELPRYRILVVDEATGKISAPEDLIGTWLAVDPGGRYLYAGYRDIYRKGTRFHINPGWRLLEVPQYGSVDWLISYSLAGREPVPRQTRMEVGGNGYGMRLSPDGRRITYLSHVGFPMHSNNLASFDPRDLEANPIPYVTKDRATTTKLAYHPTLPLIAVPGSGSAVIFTRETGQLLPDRLLLSSTGLGDAQVDHLLFSPDGLSLVFVCNDVETGRYLRTVPLRLAESDRQIAARGIAQPAASGASANTATAGPKKNLLQVQRDELDALQASGRSASPMTAKQIAQNYMPSVVHVEADDGSATGFVVGRRGYILTAAHAVPVNGEIQVSYTIETRGQARTQTTRAQIVRIDEELDLALLKIGAAAPLKPVVLADGPIEVGEQVTVVGHPGLGDQVLSNTLTTGVVSSADRELEGQRYVQTSATVNPGNSGGPMFDGQGRVIGLVALKGRIESTGFAVPAGRLREFLQAATVR